MSRADESLPGAIAQAMEHGISHAVDQGIKPVLAELAALRQEVAALKTVQPPPAIAPPWTALAEASRSRHVGKRTLLAEIHAGRLRFVERACPGGKQYLVSTAQLDERWPVHEAPKRLHRIA